MERSTETNPTVVGVGAIGAPAGETKPGDAIDRYVVVDKLGAGGMGAVYKAYDPHLGRLVAIKVLRADATSSAGTTRLLREAQAIAQLSHPNVVAVHDVGVDRDRLFIAMEFVEGAPLRTWLHESPRPLGDICEVFVQAARGLAHAHAEGIVHRDFKPDNVLVGSDGRVRVADFGLARMFGREDDDAIADGGARGDDVAIALSEPLTQAGVVMGTPPYMAPEQHQPGAPVDARADQWAFCATLYEAIAGYRPFGGNDRDAIAFNITSGNLRPLRPDVRAPRWLRDLIRCGLAVAPADRFGSMADIIDELTRDREADRRASLDGSSTTDDLVAAFPPPDDPAVAQAVDELRQRLEEAWQAKGRGAYAASLLAAEGIEDDARKLGYLPLHAAALYLLGNLRHRVGESTAARITLYEAARVAAEAGDDWQIANTWVYLIAVTGEGLGRYEEADALVEVARVALAGLGENEPLRSRLFNNHGNNLRAQGRLDEAIIAYEKSLAVDERVHGPDNPLLAIGLTNLGRTLLEAGDATRARAHLDRALTLRRAAHGDEHPYLASTLAALGAADARDGLHAEARTHLERAIALWDRALGPRHPALADPLSELAGCCDALGDADAADEARQRAAELGA